MAGAAAVIFSLALHVADQATDVFAAFVFYAEGRPVSAALTLALVFAPGLFVFAAELGRACRGESNVCKALAYLLFTPFWAIVIHFYSLFDGRYVRTALYFKSLEGFLESAPQLVLQTSLLLKGLSTESGGLVLNSIGFGRIDSDGNGANVSSIEVLGRYYDQDERFIFGLVVMVSVAVSFCSVLFSAISFNDVESSATCCSAKICAAVPFFLFTLTFRAMAVSLLVCLVRVWSGVVAFALFFLNVMSALYIGDDFPRAFSYGLWSMLVPVGYNRDPAESFGYAKVSLQEQEEAACKASSAASTPDDGTDGGPACDPISMRDVERLRDRAKHFLTAHVLSSVVVLGSALLVTAVLVQTHPGLDGLDVRVAFDLGLLNSLFVPALGLCLGLSVILARPYHRCQCSAGETPRGNFIV